MNPTGRLFGIREIIVPTPLQSVVSVLVSGVSMTLIQREALSRHFSNGDIPEFSPTHQLNLNVTHVLGLYLVGQIAIIIFWAIVGLVAYLIVWWAHNLLISARNEVIVQTSYMNQKGSRFDVIGLFFKFASLILLIGSTALLPYGLNAWLRLWQPLLASEFTVLGIVQVMGAVLGFAVELYLSFMLFQIMVDRFRR